MRHELQRVEALSAARTEKRAALDAQEDALRRAVAEAVSSGCNVAEVARAAGVSRVTVYAWAGQNKPSASTSDTPG